MWALGEGTTFLFFFPITTIYSIWQIITFVSSTSSSTNTKDLPDTTGESSGRLKVLNVANPASIRLCMRFWSELGCILLYVWICEKAPPVPHGQRFSNSFMFWSLWILFVLWSLYNIVENKGGAKSATLLNREQSEEWKGWMQYLFLAYHYFHEASVYNAIRIFVSCYVWMTGFGNFSFFYTKADFGIVRMLQMMWRLNFLVFWLCLMFSNTFILYYINPLHTFYFLTTFFVMRIGWTFNLDKWKIRSKLFVWSILVFVVWEFPTVFNAVWGLVLGTEPNPGAKSGTLHEWHFRSSLDHWSALFGMLFALNYPAATAWLKRVEGESIKTTRHTTISNPTATAKKTPGTHEEQRPSEDDFDKKKYDVEFSDEDEHQGEEQPILSNAGNRNSPASSSSSSTTNNSTSATNVTAATGGVVSPYSTWAKYIVLLPMLTGTALFFMFIYPNNKKTYNALHPYYFWIPLLTYVLVRNWSPTVRRYHSSSLAAMGKITLETYLMQHHIWLANDAKTLYVVIPNAPLLNLLVTTITYVFVAMRLFRITVGLRAMHVAETESGGPWSCIVNVCGVGVAIGLPYGLSAALVASNSATTTGFAIVGILLTIALGVFFLVAHFSCWRSFQRDLYAISSSNNTINGTNSAAAQKNAAQHKEEEEEGRRICGPTPTILKKIPIVLLVVSVCVQCASHVVWPSVPLVYHPNANPTAYAMWQTRGSQVVNAKGVFEQGNNMLWQNVTEAHALTSNRPISIYGDSLGRQTLIALGNAIYGHNQTQITFSNEDRHKDKKFLLKNGAVVHFYWSPYVATTMKLIQANANAMAKNELIVVSNGLWDMLHRPCEEISCGGKNGAGLFAAGMDSLLGVINSRLRKTAVKSSVLWLAPTLVVEASLPVEKKVTMTVEGGWNYRQAIEDRTSYLDEVLDGTALTKTVPDGETLLSKDGIHYEPFIYDNLAQGILNYLKKPVPIGVNDSRKKYSLAGISHSALLGGLVLVALTCMLVTFDIYLGFSAMARAVLGLPDVDLDDVYEKLHQTIKKVGKLW